MRPTDQLHASNGEIEEAPPPTIMETFSDKGNPADTSLQSQLPTDCPTLTNELVLQSIFSFCDVESLKRCRLVCKIWRDLSFIPWRANAVCILQDTSETQDNNPKLNYMSIMKLENLILQNEYKLATKPFISYRFDHSPLFGNEPGFERWLELSSSSLTFLFISHWEGNFSQLVDIIFTKLPNLRHFKLGPVDVVEASITQEYREAEIAPAVSGPSHLKLRCVELCRFLPGVSDLQFPWEAFFRKMPNVEKLVIYTDEMDGAADYFPEVLIAQKNAKMPSLSELDIFQPAYKTYLKTFPEELAGLITTSPLKKLSMDLGSVTNSSTIKELLTPFGKSLEFLRVIQGPSTTYPGFLFKPLWPSPLQMQALKELHLVNGVARGFRLLNGLEAPNLQKLVFEIIPFYKYRDHSLLVKMDSEFQDQFMLYDFLRRKRFLRLESFELHPKWYRLDENELRAMRLAMPNLKHFTGSLSATTFSILCKLYGGLKSLNVLDADGDYEEIGDEALTGISPFNNQFGNRKPNLTDLQELTDVTISYERAIKRKELKLTSHSIMRGFLQLPKLHSLSVAFKDDVSNWAMDALKKHVNYLNLQG